MARRICGLCFIVLLLLSACALASDDAAAGEQQVNGQNLADVASAYIHQRIGIPADSDTVAITLLDAAQDAVVPAGIVKLTVELPYGIRYNTPTNATVVIAVDGRTAAKVNLLFDVKYYQQVVVASRAIGAHEPLTADSLRYERVDVGRLAVGYMTNIQKTVGMAPRRPVAPGTVMNKSLLEKPIILRQGNVITIVARIGNIEVSAPGQALQNGVEGQLIKVQNMNSRKTIVAKVLNDSTVLVATYNGR